MLPSATQIQVRDTARAFVQQEIAPYAASWEGSNDGVAVDLLERIGALGYFGMLIPAQYGGAALDLVSYALVTEEFAAGDCGLANLINVSNSPVASAIRDHGSDAQRATYLAAMAAGSCRGCFMLSEAAAGSDAAAITTRVEACGDAFVINGAKQFVTAGHSAHLALVVAVSDPAAGKRGISTLLVPRERYRVERLEDKLGHRSVDTAAVVFEQVEIDATALLGAPGEGYRIALAYLNSGRIGVAAQGVGVARAAFEAASTYARTRSSFGKLLIEHQAIAFRLAEMATRISAARALTLHAAALVDAGRPAIAEASMAKVCASRCAEQVCSAALQIFGGYGYLKDQPIEKLYRDARVLSIYEGTNDIQNIVIARAIAAGWSPRT